MSLIWIISGSARGVGKTTLALQLCEILPDSVYVKCGRSKPKPDKPGEFFNNPEELNCFVEKTNDLKKHIVIESNSLAKSAKADFVIFIDGASENTKLRSDIDQLAKAANIKICRNADLTCWEKVLSVKIKSKKICDAVCDLLFHQKRFLFGSKPDVRSKVWLESAGGHIFGNGLAALLQNVNRLGTLQGAANASNMSYRYAWNLIRMAEHHFGKTLIDRHAGGPHGGSSTLSAEGLRLLKVFTQLNEQVAVFTNKKFAQLYKQGKVNA